MVIISACQSPSNDDFTENRPNIIWLVAEDLSPYLPSFGDSTIETPNISRLAAEGIRYTNVFSPSGVCAPSRYALATGRYPTSDGAHNMRTGGTAYFEELGLQPYEVVPPPEVRMMSEVLRSNGYYCSNNAKQDYQFKPTIGAWDDSSDSAHWRNRPGDQPFFSIFNFEITHESQFFGPPMKRNLRMRGSFPEEFDRYPWGERIDSADWQLNVPNDLPVQVPPYLPDVPAVRNDMRVMYSNIVEMDRMVGFLLDQLEEDGLLENTIIFFYTDHGGPLPRQKRLMYDSGLEVPLVIRYPDRNGAGTIDDQLISFVDFAPTVFSMAGIVPPNYLQGGAFAGQYPSPTPRSYIFAAADRLDGHYDMIRAVRNKRFKYLRNFKPNLGYYLPLDYRERITTMQVLLQMRDAGTLNEIQMQWFRDQKPTEELFDTANDPHELNNLANDPQFAEMLQELREQCGLWMERMGDKGLVAEQDILERFWPGGVQPQVASPQLTLENGVLTLISTTPGARVSYQLLENERELDSSWIPYSGPIEVPNKIGVATIADRIGWKPSEVEWLIPRE